MEEKVCGLVVGAVSYGENDKILSIFTPNKGMISAGIKGVKKAGAKLKFASEPFCYAEFVFSVRGDRYTVIGASLLESFYDIRSSVKKYYAGAVVLEFLKKFFKEEIISEQAFFLSVMALRELCSSPKSEESILAEFLIDALEITGYALNLKRCFCCGGEIHGRVYFDCNSGGFLCEQCFEGRGREIKRETYLAVEKVYQGQDCGENAIFVLKLLSYYIENRAEENLKTLNELLKLLI